MVMMSSMAQATTSVSAGVAAKPLGATNSSGSAAAARIRNALPMVLVIIRFLSDQYPCPLLFNTLERTLANHPTRLASGELRRRYDPPPVPVSSQRAFLSLAP